MKWAVSWELLKGRNPSLISFCEMHLVFLIRAIFAQQSSSPHPPTQSQYIHQAESLPSTSTFLKCIIATTFIDHNLFLTLLHHFSSAAASLMNEAVFAQIVKIWIKILIRSQIIRWSTCQVSAGYQKPVVSPYTSATQPFSNHRFPFGAEF